MNTNEGNYCLRESEKSSQTLETFKLGFKRRIFYQVNKKGLRNGRVFFAEGVVNVLSILGLPFCDRK